MTQRLARIWASAERLRSGSSFDGDGKRFLGAQFLSGLGSGISRVALPWLVLDVSGSKSIAGFVFAATILPYVFAGIPAGVISDRFSGRAVMWRAVAAQGLFAATLPLWTLFGRPPIWAIIATAFGMGTARVFAEAAGFELIASLLGPENFTKGLGVVASAGMLAVLVGPMLGGVLVAVMGAGKTLAAESICLGVAAVACKGMKRRRTASDRPECMSVHERASKGFRIIFESRFVRRLTIVGGISTFTTGGSTALLIPLLRNEIGLSAIDAGRALAAAALAGVTAGLLVGRLNSRLGGPRLFSVCILFTGVAACALAGAHGVWQSAAALCLLIAMSTIVFAVYEGERQRRVPLELQSIVGISARTLMMLCLFLGSTIASLLAAVVPLRDVFLLIGFGSFGVAALIWFTLVLYSGCDAAVPQPLEA